jgi:hypothetical protein
MLAAQEKQINSLWRKHRKIIHLSCKKAIIGLILLMPMYFSGCGGDRSTAASQ